MLDDDLLSFVRASIKSTWALELLLLLRKQAPAGSAQETLVRTLRATPSLVSSCLDQLQTAGLVAADENGSWRYQPAAPTLDDLAHKLEQAYSERPVAIINAIVSLPDDRLKSFADAFKFPKKGD